MEKVEVIIESLKNEINKKESDQIEKLEKKLGETLEEASKFSSLYELPLTNIFNIVKNWDYSVIDDNLTKFDLIKTIIEKTNKSHEKDDSTIYILKNINMEGIDFVLDDYFQIFECFSNWNFFNKMCQVYQEQNKEVDVDYEYELQLKSKEIENLKGKLLFEKSIQLHKIPVHNACCVGNLNVLRALYIRNPNLLRSYDGKARIPLHYAAEYNQLEIVKFYIEEAHFTEINIQDIEGNTPMHLACMKGHINIVKYLYSHNAALSFNYKGKKPQDYAEFFGHKDILHIFHSFDQYRYLYEESDSDYSSDYEVW